MLAGFASTIRFGPSAAERSALKKDVVVWDSEDFLGDWEQFNWASQSKMRWRDRRLLL